MFENVNQEDSIGGEAFQMKTLPMSGNIPLVNIYAIYRVEAERGKLGHKHSERLGRLMRNTLVVQAM